MSWKRHRIVGLGGHTSVARLRRHRLKTCVRRYTVHELNRCKPKIRARYIQYLKSASRGRIARRRGLRTWSLGNRGEWGNSGNAPPAGRPGRCASKPCRGAAGTRRARITWPGSRGSCAAGTGGSRKTRAARARRAASTRASARTGPSAAPATVPCTRTDRRPPAGATGSRLPVAKETKL